MEIFNQYSNIAAVVIARLFLGILFFMQGYDAVFKVGIGNVIRVYRDDFSEKGVPGILVSVATTFACLTELICGALLVLGLFEYAALYLLGLNIIIAATGFGINTPMWDTKHVMPRLMLIIFLLLAPPEWHAFSIDQIMFK
jgi:putative oxidoreductase